jgi:hypothetical protein
VDLAGKNPGNLAVGGHNTRIPGTADMAQVTYQGLRRTTG